MLSCLDTEEYNRKQVAIAVWWIIEDPNPKPLYVLFFCKQLVNKKLMINVLSYDHLFSFFFLKKSLCYGIDLL
jgi:hypothetical protein